MAAAVARAADSDVTAWVALAVAAIFAVAAAVALVRLAQRVPVLMLDDTGYRVSGLRGVGVRSAGWHEIRDIVSSGAGEQLVMIRLQDGSSTRLPSRLVDEPPAAWVSDLRFRLNRARVPRRRR